MKKFFSLIAAVLFAGSMMAIDFTLSSAEAVEKDGVTVTFDKGAGSSVPAWYDNGLRLYAKNTVTITSTSPITAISFNWQKQGSKPFSTATASVGDYTHPEEPGEGKWTGSATTVTFTLGDAGQLLLNTFSVTLGEGGGVTPDPDPQPTDDWSEIVFTEATAAGAFNDSVFAAGEFTLKCTDTDNKLKTTANTATFGTVEANKAYNFRLQTGGKSSNKNSMELTVPADGQLRIAVRTATATDLTRTLVLAQGTDTIYNNIVTDNDTVADHSPRIFNYVYADVKAGKVAVTYPVNGVNFYAFAFKAGEVVPPTPQPGDTLTCTQAAELALAGNTDEAIVKGYVTKIQEAWSSYKNVSFWMADAKDGGEVFEAFRVVCETAEEAPALGDLVWVKGNLTKYGSTPETAKGGSFGILEKNTDPVVEPKNLGEKTIAEFLEMKNQVDTCILTGVVANVANDQYGNFDLIDATDTVYVYGLLTAAGEAKKCFQEEGIAEGDTLKILAIYGEYYGTPQVKNAIFVSLAKKETVLTGDTINVTMSEGLRFYDNVAGEGWWELYGSDDKYVIELSNVSTEQIAGVYTIDDLDPEYAYIGVINGEDTTYVNFVDGAITLAVTNDGVTAVGALVGEDGNVYSLNLTYVIPTAKETVNVVIAEGTLYDELADYGLYAVYGEDENKVYVQLAIWAENGFEGNFTEEDLDSRNIGSGINDGEEPVEIYSAAITVTPGNGGDYNITADLLGYNSKLYKVSMYIGPEQGIEDVDAAVKAIKSLINGNVVIEKKGVKYNVNGAVIR